MKTPILSSDSIFAYKYIISIYENSGRKQWV
jgi:hypothetical protein